MEPGLPTASVVRSSQATPARRRGQPCIAANQPAADPLISPQARVQTSGATSLAHLWFVTLHPFVDGNGRIARAVGDLFLARADGSPQRFYSLSAQIQRERKAYYDILERTQKQSLDVTAWLAWFLETLHRAVDQAQHTLDAVLSKTRFWQRWAPPTSTPLNERQVKLVNRLLDGFEGKLTSSKWATIAKCSPDTALRDITDLLARGVLRKSDAGGRSTSYELNHSPG
jgi:Fic family protein